METSASRPELYRIAFSMLRSGSAALVRALYERGLAESDIFTMTDADIAGRLGRNVLSEGLDAASRRDALARAERELKFIDAHRIRPLFITDAAYPVRLAQIEAPPVLIYMLGDADLNDGHPLSVVGTRKMTPYGAEHARRLTRELAEYFPDLLVASGLAYGVDSVAHTTALECGVRTVGVLAHGLDTIYPAQHRDLARRILAAGGALVTQYPSGVRPFRANFLERNRIVAGMSDATIVIESEIKGGAMSTARHAFEANRDLFALPGRAGDQMSAGCNHLIRTQRATLITAAADLVEVTGWQPMGVKVRPEHRSLFPELEGEAAKIYEYLRFESEPRNIDTIFHFTQIPMARLMSLLSDLEFDGVIVRHPGNRFAVAT